ncbi:MAG: CAP domain-containing protein [Syntrophomonadaceae bacterium]|nr:CAP domain-containing protein [Syntrophomonadaceae bacterium]
MHQEMLRYINIARVKAHLTPLVLNRKLSAGAYYKSRDMAVSQYFDHYSPTYGSPFTMMKHWGIQFHSAAENIAVNRSIKSAHKSLMKSPGHRANILNPEYGEVGLGFYRQGSCLYITQWFID